MFTTVLPVWGVALLVSFACWNVGSALVTTRSPMVAMLAGWCALLFLCAVPWMLGVPANVMRPLFWVFFATGLWLAIRHHRWREFTVAALCTAAITAVLGAPFLKYPQLLAYGAHGTDMWGYVLSAEWLQSHSTRELPELGVSPMRFNWTWYVLTTRERPLIYESLACLASGTGLGVANAYLAYPIALIGSLATALACEPRIFRLKSTWLALPLALAVAFHPMIVLPWIAGYMGAVISALFVTLAFAAIAVAGNGEERHTTFALGILMLLFCAALYSEKLLLIALALGGAEAGLLAIAHVRAHGWRRWPPVRMSVLQGATLVAGGLMLLAIFALGRNQAVGQGEIQSPRVAIAHVLGLFGGRSPYTWYGYIPHVSFDREPWENPVGVVLLVGMLVLLLVLAWGRWKTDRCLRLPLLVGLCAGVLFMSAGDETTMARTLMMFGFGLLVMLAVVSSELPRPWIGLFAALICCLPCVRSAAEMDEIISGPYIIATEQNLGEILDGQNWRLMCYLSFREDRDGFDWSKTPRFFRSMTIFLPAADQKRLIQKYGVKP